MNGPHGTIWLFLLSRGGWWTVQEVASEMDLSDLDRPDQVMYGLFRRNRVARRKRKTAHGHKYEFAVLFDCCVPRDVTLRQLFNESGREHGSLLAGVSAGDPAVADVGGAGAAPA